MKLTKGIVGLPSSNPAHPYALTHRNADLK